MRARLGDRRLNFGLRRAAHLHAVADVFGDGHMRIKRVILEHHRAIAQARTQVCDIAFANTDAAEVACLDAGDHPQSGRLSAAGRADQNDELLVGDGEIERGDGRHRTVVFLDVDEGDTGHVISALFGTMRFFAGKEEPPA